MRSCTGSSSEGVGGGDQGDGEWVQVELPLGATEDRICGTIDIEKALSEGIKAYEPGLLVHPALNRPLPGLLLARTPHLLYTYIYFLLLPMPAGK